MKEDKIEIIAVNNEKTNKNKEHRRALTELKNEILDVDLSRIILNSSS